ncbi:MAG TPA: chemotaxis protein CheD [Gemmatimonadales bacterium]|nr:chemotaxis protein CheD [Gemmatimonadales bacterium]
MTGRELVVRVAELQVGGRGEVLVTIGLGSCVAIVLHDPVAAVGGLAHVLLPSPSLSRRDDAGPGRFPQTAVPALVEAMAGRGAVPRRLTARLVGGAAMFTNLAPVGTIQMGERNGVASRQALLAHGIAVVGEDLGGDYGRTVRLHVATGDLDVTSLRHGARRL